ncbi:hypothetical protein BOX15_Mlig019743g2, partial [Macrostomum lignano]
TALLLFRFFFIFLPQTGYLHPDEFMQSIEISAGDLLGVRTSPPPWEFTVDRPIRSAAILHLFYHGPLLLFKHLLVDGFSWYVDAYFVVIVTRLSIAVLSLANDAMVALLARELGLDTFRCLFLYSSSYIVMVHGTRTLSNAIESSLLAIVFICLLFAFNAYSAPGNSRHTLVKVLLSTAGIVTAIGVMNRPTFVAFAAVPYLYTAWRCARSLVDPIGACFNFGATILAAFSAAFVSLVLYDTLTFNPTFASRFASLGMDEFLTVNGAFDFLSDFARSAVVTPWNFVSYNSQSENLAQHGTHPRWLHLINLALLLGPAAPVFVRHAWATLRQSAQQQQQQQQQLSKAIVLACLVPLAALSLFPHQELRFLVPLLPLATVCVAQRLRCRLPIFSFALPWIAFNAIAVIGLGFLHQGGVLPMTAHVGELIRSTNSRLQPQQEPLCHRLLFLGTYPPPQHTLLLPQSTCVQLEDLMGNRTALESRAAQLRSDRVASVYAVFSAVHADPVRAAFAKSRYGLKYAARVYGHLSAESLPPARRVLARLSESSSPVVEAGRSLSEALSIMVFHLVLTA